LIKSICKIPLCQAQCMPYCGLVQVDDMLYGTLWNEKKLARLTNCGQCRCGETVCRPYWKICGDPCGCSLWALAQYKSPFIYKLDHDFNEIDRICVKGKWTSRNYMKNLSCHHGCLYITTNQGVYQADESGKLLACVKKSGRNKGYDDYLVTERGRYSAYTTANCHCIAKDTCCGGERVLLSLKKNVAVKKLLVYCHEGCCYVAALVVKERRYSYLVVVDKIWGAHKKEEEKWLENYAWEADPMDVPHGGEDKQTIGYEPYGTDTGYQGYDENKEDKMDGIVETRTRHDQQDLCDEGEHPCSPQKQDDPCGPCSGLLPALPPKAWPCRPVALEEIPTCKLCCSCYDQEAINGIITSVALMEKSLARLLDGEGEKLHKIISNTDDLCKIQRTNDSVTQLVEKITLLEQVLLQKLECVKCQDHK